MLSLAAPVFVEQLLTLSVTYTDWWLTGHFFAGEAPKAAMGLMGYIGWLLPSLFAAIAIGSTALVSRRVGAGSMKAASRVTNQAFLLGLILAAIVTLAFYFGGDELISIMRLEAASAELAVVYLSILTFAIPAIMFNAVAVACLRGAGDTMTGFVVRTIVNFVNIVVSTSLVWWGESVSISPWAGIAIGTTVAHCSGAAIFLILLALGRSGLRLSLRAMRPHTRSIRRLLSIGLPGGLDVIAILGCHFVYVSLINDLGDLAAASHGLGVQIEGLAYMPGAAFQVSAATLTGQFLGARQSDQAVRGGMASLAAALAVMCAAALVFFVGGHWLAAFFTGDFTDPIVPHTGELLKIGAVAIPPLAAVMVLSGALRGAGDTRMLMVYTLIGFVGVRIPGACWLAWDHVSIPFTDWSIPGAGWGVYGAWWAMAADVFVRCGLISYRYWRGSWKTLRL